MLPQQERAFPIDSSPPIGHLNNALRLPEPCLQVRNAAAASPPAALVTAAPPAAGGPPPAAAPPPPAIVRFDSPTVHNAPLDFCWGYGSDWIPSQCGSFAAYKWCQLQGFSGAADFGDPVVAPGATGFQRYDPGSKLCTSQCVAFSSITCTRGGTP